MAVPSPSVTQIALYQQAVKVFTLSRKLTTILSQKESLVGIEGATTPQHIALRTLIDKSLSLPAQIAYAESSREYHVRLGYVKVIKTAVKALQKNYQELSRMSSSPYVKKHGKELKHLQRLYKSWESRIALSN